MTVEQAHWHVSDFASRLRRGQTPHIAQGMVDAAMCCWRAGVLHADVNLIARHYPLEFPASVRQAA
jgi:hypothetical protein